MLEILEEISKMSDIQWRQSEKFAVPKCIEIEKRNGTKEDNNNNNNHDRFD